MKTIFTAFIIAFSFSVNAGSGNGGGSYLDYLKGLSWEELDQNWDVDFEGDQIWFGGHMLSILDTCMADEETFRTVDKKVLEVQDGDDWRVVGEDYLYKSIYGKKAMVDGDDVIMVPVVHKTSRTIKVVDIEQEFFANYLFKKEFTVPACE